MWSIIRHGTRNPSKKIIAQANESLGSLKERIVEANLDAANSPLCPSLVQRLKYWHFNVDPKDEKILMTEGEDELIELAERMQNRFPELFIETFKPKLYNVKYTSTQRTWESARSFAIGLFGRHRISKMWDSMQPAINDPVLKVSE